MSNYIPYVVEQTGRGERSYDKVLRYIFKTFKRQNYNA